MIDRQQLEARTPRHRRVGAFPSSSTRSWQGRAIEAAAQGLRDADWRSHATYLASRPDRGRARGHPPDDPALPPAPTSACTSYISPLRRHQPGAAGDARNEGLPITVETCPHHLHFRRRGNRRRRNPAEGALRQSAAKKTSSTSGTDLRDGIIDMIVTDHSPCPPAMKRQDLGPLGSCLGRNLPASPSQPADHPHRVSAAVAPFTLDDVVRWMSSAPAALAGISPPRRRARSRARSKLRRLRHRNGVHRHRQKAALPTCNLALPQRNTARGDPSKTTYLRGEPVYSACLL